MGCGSSKVSDIDLIDVAPRRQRQGGQAVQVALNRGNLNDALEYTAAYLSSCGQHLILTVVGGAVNTILLQTRLATHDIDIFSNNLSRDESRVLQEAATYARRSMAQKRGVNLPTDWLNSATTIFVPPNLRNTLRQEALAQNEAVFNSRGLTLLAAPWQYAVAAKLHRISGGNPNQNDAPDAASYLHRYLQGRRMNAIAASSIRHWINRYEVNAQEQSILILDEAYVSRYGRRAIDFQQ
ncbi:MAG: hypothetical protein M1814_000321 [Vezdaea aestivalis]|nr:MAG: hypothetical protein M1814_000321 [Vezdaea aestivalis]